MNWTRRKFIKSGIIASITLLILDAFWLEQVFIETKEFYLNGTTAEKPHLKIVQISDLHLTKVGTALKKKIEEVNALRPDLIVLTGDSVDNANNLPLLEELMGLMDKNIQKAAILGNWEYWSNTDISKLNLLYQRYNCDLLINSTKQYQLNNQTISVTGTDDLVGGNADIETALVPYRKSNHHIILNHCPAYTDQIVRSLSTYKKPDLILSGHTHGGQVNLFGFIPFLPEGSGNYLKGWYKPGGVDLYVSKGIGTSLLPVRFGSRAEISVFNI